MKSARSNPIMSSSLALLFHHQWNILFLPACLFATIWNYRVFFGARLFPYGIPHRLVDRPTFGAVDPTNDSLRFKHGKLQKIYERRVQNEDDDSHYSTDGTTTTTTRLLSSPETVFFGQDGTLYTATDHGNLISLTDWKQDQTQEEDSTTIIITAKATLVKDLGPGRPLGAKFTADGSTLYIADAVLGLLRLRNPHDPRSKVEIVASTVSSMNDDTTTTNHNKNNIGGQQSNRILFANDLTIGPVTGKVYFTDASTVPPPRNYYHHKYSSTAAADDDTYTGMTYDAMYASKVDTLRANPSGRLLEYDPSTDAVTVLADNLWFANGIGVDPKEEYLVFAETFRLSLAKYYLNGERKGQMECIVKGDPSPAYFDGVDCAWNGVTANTLCFAANPSSVVPAAKLLLGLPHPLDWILRTILIMLPKEWLPETEPYGGITVIDPETSSYVGLIQDPTGQDIGHITGVTVYDNKLFLGSLSNDFIGVYDLS